MDTIRAAVVDLDGTVWRGDELIDGARAGLATLREAGVPVVFVTNGINLRAADFADRLAALGLPEDAGEVVTAGSATADYVAGQSPGVRTFVLGPPELHAECRDAGLELVDSGTADVIVAGRAPELDGALLQRTLDVYTPETDLVATSTDPTHPVEDGFEPGSGATVGAIEGMTEREATVVGKPSSRMAEIALTRLGVAPEECLIVGDRLGTDVEMGEDAGMTTALVLSGASSQADVSDGEGPTPDHVLDSLGDVGRILAD
ncbi:HAD family hydrolase [Halobacteriales archaeon QH_10_67_22]|nr:MAG: HAD family hydrolase [Halobacteriales archaeon QH_10_67_22]